MILSDGDILRRLETGELVIEPLDDPDLQIQPASVDLRLGREFLTFNHASIQCIRPERGAEIARYVNRTTIPGSNNTGQQTLRSFEHIDEDEDDQQRGEFILHPGDFVLGTTKERVAIPNDIIAHVEGRSSLGRLAIVVHASLPADEEVFVWLPAEGYGCHPIGELVEHRPLASAVSFDPTTLTVRTFPITNYIRNPARRIVRVTLASGRSVTVTRDHNLFTLDESGRVTRVASEDAIGSLVMVPRSLPTPFGPDTVDRHAISADPRIAADGGIIPDRPGTATQMTQHESLCLDRSVGTVMGQYLSCGSIDGSRMCFAPVDSQAMTDVEAWCTSTAVCGAWEAPNRFVVTSSVLVDSVRELFGAEESRTIPNVVFNWPTPVRHGFLTGLLGPRGEDRLGSAVVANRSVARRVMYLALGLGLAPTVAERGDGRVVVSVREAPGRDRWPNTEPQRNGPPDGSDASRGSGDIRFEEVVAVTETDRVEPTYDLEVQPGGRPVENFLGGDGVFLSNTAGIVDPGYQGQITLELSNLGTAPVALTPDMRIAQLTFTKLTSPAERPYGEERGSKYQGQRGPQASRIEDDHEFSGKQR